MDFIAEVFRIGLDVVDDLARTIARMAGEVILLARGEIHLTAVEPLSWAVFIALLGFIVYRWFTRRKLDLERHIARTQGKLEVLDKIVEHPSPVYRLGQNILIFFVGVLAAIVIILLLIFAAG